MSVILTSVTDVGYRNVYDLEMPVYHNFIANSIDVHNSSDPEITV